MRSALYESSTIYESRETASRMQQGADCTWSANNFKGFWKQRFSFFIAMDRASKTNLHIGASEPKMRRGWGAGG